MTYDQITIILVSVAELDGDYDYIATPWSAECCLCGGPIMSAMDNGMVWESECYCSVCGAVDAWGADDGVAYLRCLPDEGPTLTIVREVYETEAALAAWGALVAAP